MSPNEVAVTEKSPADRPKSARAREKISRFWQRCDRGSRARGSLAQFASEARTSYGLYSREVDWGFIARASRWKKPFRVAGALFWAMLMKLSPARRVLLLAALLLVLFGRLQVRGGKGSVDFDLLPVGIVILVLLLALELADRVIMKRDLEIAREIQQWLVPAAPPEVPGVDIAFITRPANTVAGDYYDALLPRGEAESPKLLPTRIVCLWWWPTWPARAFRRRCSWPRFRPACKRWRPYPPRSAIWSRA